VIGVDGSEIALKAARYGIALAKRIGARVHIVNVIEYAAQGTAGSAGLSAWAVMLPAVQHEGRAAVDLVAHEALAAGVLHTTEVIDATDAASGIVAEASTEGAELIVVGSHGRTGVRRALIGSVAEKVLRLAHCPVLVIR
jgi:nucleotide-binding universal stress UspA family protein